MKELKGLEKEEKRRRGREEKNQNKDELNNCTINLDCINLFSYK